MTAEVASYIVLRTRCNFAEGFDGNAGLINAINTQESDRLNSVGGILRRRGGLFAGLGYEFLY